MLKDSVTAKDRQITALQARLHEQAEEDTTKAASGLDEVQLRATFTSMDAKSAAEMLIKLADVNSNKVLRILRAVNDGTRSSLLAEMSKVDQTITTQLLSRLMPDS